MLLVDAREGVYLQVHANKMNRPHRRSSQRTKRAVGPNNQPELELREESIACFRVARRAFEWHGTINLSQEKKGEKKNSLL